MTAPQEQRYQSAENSTKEAARGAAERAEGRARAVADEAAQESRHVARQAKERLLEQADDQAHQLGEALERLAEQLDALADGRVEEAGDLVGYSRDAAGRARTLATRMEHLGVDGMARELSAYARRRPGRFLLGAVTAGVLVGRLGRNLGSGNGTPPQEITASAVPTAGERATGPRADDLFDEPGVPPTLPPTAEPEGRQAHGTMRGLHDV